MKTSIAHSRGFTLIEMAMVLLIMGLLLGGGLTLLGGQIESQKTKDSQRLLEEAKEALIGFAVANGRLPCPAPATAVTGSTLAGLETAPVATGCANLAGVLPWATLGINEADAWGNRFTYRVSKEFTRPVNQTTFASCPPAPPAPAPPASTPSAAFALCSQGDMTVLSTAGGATLASTVPAMVISHGKNGNGAYYTGGNQLAVGTDTDELDNQLTGTGIATANLVFINKTPTDTFDDLVIWLSPNILFNRMVQAGRLP
jgi:prepilin-type N-terminal cleavage/methylation domain-containing protein